jgi:HEAT repeat protein
MIRSVSSDCRGGTLLLLVLAAGCGDGDRVSTLIAQLKDTDGELRIAAADGLGELGAEAGAAVPALGESLRDVHPGVRQASARALGKMGDGARPAVASLEGALDDPELIVQLAAAWALVKLDPDGKKYVPVLTATMQAGEGGTIVAVGGLGPQAEWAVPTLTKLLQDKRSGVRRLAAEALGKIGPQGDATAALEQATRDADDQVRAAAEAALGRE